MIKTINNQKVLIAEIEKNKNLKLNLLKNNFEEKKKEIKLNAKKKLDYKLKKIDFEYKKSLERIKKQFYSSFDLEKNKKKALIKNQIYNQVINEFKTEILNNNNKKHQKFINKLFEILVKKIISESDKEIKELIIPNSIAFSKEQIKKLNTLNSSKSNVKKSPIKIKKQNFSIDQPLDEIKIIAKINQYEELEITLEDIIKEHSIKINQIIDEYIFNKNFSKI